MTADCRCTYQHCSSHDRLLGMLDDAELLRHLISLTVDSRFETESEKRPELFDLGALDDFESFVAQHNWSDPVAAYDLGSNLTSLARLVGEDRPAGGALR